MNADDKLQLYLSNTELLMSMECASATEATLAVYELILELEGNPHGKLSLDFQDSPNAVLSKDTLDRSTQAVLSWPVARFKDSSYLIRFEGGIKLSTCLGPVRLSFAKRFHDTSHSEVSTVACPDRRWWKAKRKTIPSFGQGHYALGSFCAFTGRAGHARVVSTRWLDHGPFRVIPDGDTTWVQFHDLEADEDTAWSQAHPGHLWMADKNHGGFVERSDTWFVFEPSSFDRATGTSIVLVHGSEELTGLHMLEAACAKVLQPFDGITVQQVAFVFFDEANARKHLHALWLRGLECRWMSPRGEVRLDTDYDPTPPPRPDWVVALQDKEGM